MALILPFEASSPRQLYVAVEEALRVDCAEAVEVFGPLNDMSVIAALWNSGPTNRAAALKLADRDRRINSTPTGEQP